MWVNFSQRFQQSGETFLLAGDERKKTNETIIRKFFEIEKEVGIIGSAGKESTCNAGDLGSPWVGKTPWRRERLPTLVFWPGEFHGLYRPQGHKELDMTK